MSLRPFDVHKALGDATRYAIYELLDRTAAPLTTNEVAAELDLHPNTIRPHLDQLREVGLVEVTVDQPSGVGRPLHRYAASPGHPFPVRDSPGLALFAGLLARMATESGLSAEDAESVGRQQGRADAAAFRTAPSCLEALVQRLHLLGFDPSVDAAPPAGQRDVEDDRALISFASCPFQAIAEQNPTVVCALHRGLVAGFVESMPDGAVEEFHPLVSRTPCRMTLVSR